MLVGDAMTTKVRTVGCGALLKEVAALLARDRIGGVPVVDGRGSVVGVITTADIVLPGGRTAPRRGLLRRTVRVPRAASGPPRT